MWNDRLEQDGRPQIKFFQWASWDSLSFSILVSFSPPLFSMFSYLLLCHLLVVIKSTLLFLRFVLSHSMDSFFVPSVLVSRCPLFTLFCGDSNSFFLERLIASTNTHRVLDSLMRSPPEIFSQFWSLLETVTGPISRNHMLTCLIGSGLLLFGCNKGFLLVCKSPNWAPASNTSRFLFIFICCT